MKFIPLTLEEIFITEREEMAMTSKHSLWTRWVQQNKRYTWLYVINSILLLFLGPIQLLHNLTDLAPKKKYFIDWTLLTIGFDNKMAFLFAILGALAGIYGFSYLHSQKKIDFYHSQPISDCNRFLYIYGCGLLCCYIPYTITSLINLVIVQGYGILTFDLFQQILATMLLQMLAYFAAYQVAILMAIITGNILYSIGLTIFAFIYEIVIRKIIENFSCLFFYTFHNNSSKKILQCKWSTVWTLLQKSENIFYRDSSKEMWETVGSTCIWVAMLSIITAAIAYLAYKKRPLEYTGPSLAFPKLKPIVKALLIIISVLFTVNLYFDYISYNYYYEYTRNSTKIIMAIPVLMLFVTFICHILCEFLWELDIRAVRKNLLPSLIAGGFTLVIMYSFYFDWFGYDAYVPNAKDVEYVRIGFDTDYDNYETYQYYKKTKLTCVEDACNAAKEICKNSTNYGANLLDNHTRRDAVFIFRMKDGSTCYRNYEVIIEEGKTPLPSLLNNEEYKKVTQPFIYDDNYTERIRLEAENYLFWRDKSNNIETLNVQGKEQIKKLQQALREDLKAHPELTPFTLRHEHTAIGLLTVEYPVEDANMIENPTTYTTNYLVFPEYTRTMACLQEMGVTTDSTIGLSLEDITAVKLYTASDKNDKKTITDATQIKEVLSLSGNNWQTFIPNLENTDYNIDVYFNNSGKTTIHFKGCDLPDWITQLFKK